MNPEGTRSTLPGRIWRFLVGKPRDPADRAVHHHLLLVPLLAWVGLGADGLSSSAYGPEEAFRTLGEHRYLGVLLALATAGTVFLIAAGYSRIIEAFPQGGGGYVVGTALLGKAAGVVSGSALLVDYVLTVTISIAAATDALFSYAPAWMHSYHLHVDFVLILLLVILNIRGIRESVTVLAPIFMLFAVTHLLAILGGFALHVPQLGATVRSVGAGFQDGASTLGLGGMLLLLLHAYSLGGGTYTGIEAASNGLPMLREPRVRNGKRTMLLMAASLAFTAGGLLLLYLLWNVAPKHGMTMNAALLERMTEHVPGGAVFAFITIFSEGALLVVAAQTGFADGPRILATMAVDSWLPRRFAALSERLTTHNGIILIGAAALAALLYTGGHVGQLIVLYSINVFITFSISMLGMLTAAIRAEPGRPQRRRDLFLFGAGFVFCALILGITIAEKFHEGGWVTLVVTGVLVAICFAIKRHYRHVSATLSQLYAELERLPAVATAAGPRPVDAAAPTAVLLVGEYGGLGIHMIGAIIRGFPGHFKNIVFVSVAVVDSGEFKGESSVEGLKARVQSSLDKYVDVANRLGLAATSRMGVGTEVVDEAEAICSAVGREFPRSMYFTGKVIFAREGWYHRLLHNETALAIQQRLQWQGKIVVVLPARIA